MGPMLGNRTMSSRSSSFRSTTLVRLSWPTGSRRIVWSAISPETNQSTVPTTVPTTVPMTVPMTVPTTVPTTVRGATPILMSRKANNGRVSTRC